MEPVEPAQMNICQSYTYRKDLSWLHFNDEPRVPERQQVKEQQSCISIFVSYPTILGVHIDGKPNFNHHINKLCKSARNQLNALTWLKSFLGLKERVVLVNSFTYSNFDYWPLVWMLSHKKSLNKIESLHKRALRFLLNDYENSYEELLEKSGKCNMNLQRIRFLCIEIYKTINSLNPNFMKKMFEIKKITELSRKDIS